MRTAGAEQKVAIADNVTLDFTGLFAREKAPENPAEPPLVGNECKTTTGQEKPIEGHIGGLERKQAKQLFLQATREQEDHQRSIEVYATYQENIKASERLQAEILKGLRVGGRCFLFILKGY